MAEEELNEREFDRMMQSALLISVNRLYDVMLSMFGTMDNEKASQLRSMHEQGKLLAPPPSIDTNEF